MPPPQHGAHRSRRSATSGVTTVTMATAGAFVLGLVFLIVMLAQPRLVMAERGDVTRAGGLTLVVNEARWVAHDMSPGGMPMGAMGDMPAPGDARLHVEALVANAAGGDRRVDLSDLRLAAGARTWPPQRSSRLGSTHLAGGQSLLADLYFEVPSDTTGLHLSLTRAGQRVLVDLGLEPGMENHR